MSCRAPIYSYITVSLADLSEAVSALTLLRPITSRGYVWTPTRVAAYIDSIYSLRFARDLVTRCMSSVGDAHLTPISYPSRALMSRAALPATAGSVDTTAIIDGFNRLAAIQMVAHGQFVPRGHTDQCLSQRLSFDPLTEKFSPIRCRATFAAVTSDVLPDVSVLLSVSDPLARGAVIDRHVEAMARARGRRNPLSTGEEAHARMALVRLACTF